MTKDEALRFALEALQQIAHVSATDYEYQQWAVEAITAIKEALMSGTDGAQPEQEPKYHRGNRLICLETEEYCVIHISGTDRQWVKFPDSYIGVYTNEQVAELFELLPKEPEQEPVATIQKDWKLMPRKANEAMLKAMDECSTEGYDERLYAGHAASVYMAAWDALPEPKQEQEPVVWMYQDKSTHEVRFQKHMRDFVDHSKTSEVPLYSEPLANHELQCVCGAVWCGDEMVHLPNKAPMQRKPLTDEQLKEIWLKGKDYGDDWLDVQGIARAIEAAHGIKGEA